MQVKKLNSVAKFFIIVLANFGALAQAQQICQSFNILPSAQDTRYQTNSAMIITDKSTGLMWRTCAEGTFGSQCESGIAVKVSWGEALLYVNKANHNSSDGFTDWRLPNIRELNSLVEVQCANPSINLRIFPNTSTTHFWTSSPYDTLDFYSWYVDFSNGETNTDDRVNPKHIRLVRAGH